MGGVQPERLPPPKAFRCCHRCWSPVRVGNHVPSPPPVLPPGSSRPQEPGGVRADWGGGALSAARPVRSCRGRPGDGARSPASPHRHRHRHRQRDGGHGWGAWGRWGGARCSRGRGEEREGARGEPGVGAQGAQGVRGGQQPPVQGCVHGKTRPRVGPRGSFPCPRGALPFPSTAQRAGGRGMGMKGAQPQPGGRGYLQPTKARFSPKIKSQSFCLGEKKRQGHLPALQQPVVKGRHLQ